MRKFVILPVVLLSACWAEDVDIRQFGMAAGETVSISVETDVPLWVTFEAPEDFDFETLSETCPILEDGMSDLPMCGEIAQVGPDDIELARVRGVIGAGMKFTPYDGAIDLSFTNFSALDLTYEIRIHEDPPRSGFL